MVSSKSNHKLIITGFHSLSEPLRLAVLQLLKVRELCVCELCEILKVNKSKLSFHLKTLKEADLVSARQEGRWVYYSLNNHQFAMLEKYVAQYANFKSVFSNSCSD